MADFRKWLLAFAVLVLMSGLVNAQALKCVATGGTPPILRAEGLTELTGDIVLNCTGSVAPTTPVNIQVFLQTPITNRISSSVNGNGLAWTDALLLVNDQITPICGTVDGSGCTSPGVYQGQLFSTNSIVWQGVTIPAPGTTGVTLRITGVRTAPGVPTNPVFPNPVVEFVAVNPPSVLQIDNPQITVGYSQYGLLSDATTSNTITVGPKATSGIFSVCQSGQAPAQLFLSATEGFASAFKYRNVSQLTTPLSTTNAPQPVPGGSGTVYYSETGFYLGGGLMGGAGVNAGPTNGTRLMFTITNPTEASLTVPDALPLFFRGTMTPTNGFAVLVSTDANGENTPRTTAPGLPFAPGTATDTLANMLGPLYTSANATAVSAAYAASPVPVPHLVSVPSNGVVVYEIVASNPNALESLNVPVTVNFPSFSSNGTQIKTFLPTTATASVSFAPLTTEANPPAGAAASATLPIPRFWKPAGSAANVIGFTPCFCNILFPFVTSQQGYETGIAISNTTMDPFAGSGNGAKPQAGGVVFNYYGQNAPTCTGNNACATTADVPAGGQVAVTVSGGGGIIIPNGTGATVPAGLPAAPNFQGYIIAQAKFQYCHGFAFIICNGCGPNSPGASEAYVGLILDAPIGYRTGNASESLGN